MTVSLQRSLHDARSFSQLVRSEVLTVVMMIMIMCCVVTPTFRKSETTGFHGDEYEDDCLLGCFEV
jgi:hypothetical protein